MSRDITLKNENWKILFTFSLIRLVLAIVLCVFFIFKVVPDQKFFQYYINWNISAHLSVLYLAFVIVNLVILHFKKLNFTVQIYTIVIFDVLLFTTLVYFNSVIALSLVVLINAIVAGGCLVTQGKTSLFFAAVAALALIFLSTYQMLYNRINISDLVIVGLGGASYFITALLVYNISQNMRLTKIVADQRARDIQELKKINSLIIQRMQMGLIVVDKDYTVDFINPAAEKLLANTNLYNKYKLDNELEEKIRHWFIDKTKTNYLSIQTNQRKLLLYIINLENKENPKIAIFIEDAEFTEKRAQQLKLASLGKFTASIAHEIRNPLSAINQAVELLHDDIKSTENSKIFDMVINNISRINSIITNILQLSKRQSIEPVRIELVQFVNEYIQEHTENEKITFEKNAMQAIVEFEPKQLYQVLNNLVENAFKYNAIDKKIKIKVEKLEHETILSVVDYGAGVPEKQQYLIFEPFYTTHSIGTGLGLFICKEFCNMYHADIYYEDKPNIGACFSVRFKTVYE